jgi:TrmH family RNA methyltransferase
MPMTPPLRITSPANERVKAVVRLRTRRERDKRGLLVVEEPLVIRRALTAGATLREVWACPEQQAPDAAALYGELVAAGLPAVEVPAAIMNRISYRDNAEGLLVVARRRQLNLADLALPSGRPALLVVLVAVEKPGNAGAVLRIADGAGADAVLLCDGSTDLDNPNCLRASRGTCFTIPAVATKGETARSWLQERGVAIVATAPAGAVHWDEADLSPAWLQAADRAVTIPMAGAADSLNVAATAAVLLYEAVRQRRAAAKRTES